MPRPQLINRQLKALGANLRRERVARNVTQEQLSERADLNIRTLQKIEAGQTNILITTAARLRTSLGCTWDALMNEAEAPASAGSRAPAKRRIRG